MNWLVRIFLFLMAGFMLMMVLLFSLLGLTLGLLRWLITGKKPQIAVIFSSYRQWKKQAAQHMRRGSANEDIIEAEVREVPTLPDSTKQP
jgi:hypothetical protein